MSSNKNVLAQAAIAAGVIGGAYWGYKRAQRHSADALLQAAGQAFVHDIAEVMACDEPPVRISRFVENAAATANEILLNPDFIHAAMHAVCSDPVCQRDLAVGILAHEVSHVVHGDVLAPPWNKHDIEIRADAFSATASARLRVSSEAFAKIIWQLAEHHSGGPFGYPSRYDRVNTIRAAYAGEHNRLLIELYQLGRRNALRRFGFAG